MRKKPQLSDALYEFVIFLKLGFLMVKDENLYCQFFSCFTEPILADFQYVVMVAIQRLNGVEKNSVAISLMLNHNLTGL